MENLPQNYSRIFQFQSFERTRRRILSEAAAEEEGAMVKKIQGTAKASIYYTCNNHLLHFRWAGMSLSMSSTYPRL